MPVEDIRAGGWYFVIFKNCLMKKVSFLTLLLTAFIAFSLSAVGAEPSAAGGQPAYKAAVLFDAKGPVKEIKLKTQNKMAARSKKVKFSRDGEKKWSSLTYDNSGLPVGFDINFGSTRMSLKVDYDDARLPVSMRLASNLSGESENVVITNTYADGRLVSQGYEGEQSDGAVKRVTLDFSDWKYDEAGNWVERAVRETEKVVSRGINDGQEVMAVAPGEVKDYVETRTIKYYE